MSVAMMTSRAVHSSVAKFCQIGEQTELTSNLAKYIGFGDSLFARLAFKERS
jgi:hypothetical protein